MDPTRDPYDAVIVGARCAGAATGMLLARAGARVLVVDRGGYGADTLSTHALMRGAVLQLHRWGVLDDIRRAGTPPVRHTVFHYDDGVVEVPIAAGDGIDALYAPRRTLLDRVLVDAARAAGAEVRHGVRVTALTTDEATGRVTGVRADDVLTGPFTAEASVVIGADGRGSSVARAVGAGTTLAMGNAGGVVFGYFTGLPADGYHWYFREGAGAGVIPTDGGVSVVFAAVPQSRFRREVRRDVAGGFHRILAEVAPEVATAVAAVERVGPWRSFPGQPGFLRRAWGPGWALVGDAGSFKDPISAHGITDALRDAELLADAVLAHRAGEDATRAFGAYEAVRDELTEPIIRTTDAMASFAWDRAGIQDLHIELSRAMKAELVHLGSRGPVAKAA